MSESESNKAVAFEIDFGDGPPKKSAPKRLRQVTQTEKANKKSIEDKLQEAEKRRQSEQADRLRRIQAREADCKRVTSKVKGYLGYEPDKNLKLT